MKQKLQNVELKRRLVSQQTVFIKAKSQSEAAVKASFIVVAEIAKAARLFTEGEFVKNCMINVCDIVSFHSAVLNCILSLQPHRLHTKDKLFFTLHR